MGAANLFAYSLRPLLKKLRRWWLRRQLARIEYELIFLDHQRQNDRLEERMLQARQALLRSDLRNF